MRILNLYAGIGGNRKLWGNEHEITAVEYDKNIAAVYKDLFPSDEIIIGDAHEFLLNNFKDYDFIWSSPPCPSHSKLRLGLKKIVYPEMSLYQEIILLSHWFSGGFVVENVNPYYKPLIVPSIEIDRHLFWTNFKVLKINVETNWRTGKVKNEKELLENIFGFNLNIYSKIDKRKCLRNAVIPEVGLHFLNAFENSNVKQPLLF